VVVLMARVVDGVELTQQAQRQYRHKTRFNCTGF